MKTEQPILITSIKANQDLSKNLCISVEGVLSEEDEFFIGVVNANTLAGEFAPIMVQGIALCIAGDAINAGYRVKTGANGTIYQNISETITPTHVGIALDSATASGDIIRVLLK